MKQCLFCDKPCAETAIFCDDCRARLLKRQQQRAGEPAGQEVDLSRLMPDVWPELAVENSESSGNVVVVEAAEPDPLLHRHRPRDGCLPEQDTPVYTESLHPDRQGRGENAVLASFVKRRVKTPRIYTIFAVLACLAALAIIVDGVLLALDFARHDRPNTGNALAISVSPRVVQRGQSAMLSLKHFPPNAEVFLTHDVGQLLLNDSGSPLLRLRPDGSRNVHILIEPDWSLGSHTIEAEDVKTRDTISAALQVTVGQTSQAPVCGVTVNPAALIFSMAAGQIQPASRPVMVQSSNCAISERWQASSYSSWLSVTPSSGQLTPGKSVQVIVQVNDSALAGTASSYVAFVANQQTQLLAVQVTGAQGTSPGSQPTGTASSAPGASSFAIVPASLNFNATAGQPDPAGQIVTITNTGSAALQWQASASVSWLAVSPRQNTIAAGQSEQVVASVNAAQLNAGNYNASVIISETGGAASQQIIMVSVAIAAPCTMQASPTSLSFSATTLHSKTTPQYVTLKLAGYCAQSVAWKASVDQSWLDISPASGTNGARMTVSTSTTLPVPGTYTASITLSASSGSSTVQVNQPSIPVTLVVSL